MLAAVGLLLLWPIRLVEEPNPDWRLLFWGHALCLVMITACGIVWAGGSSYLIHFAFPLCFLLLAVPWPSGLEQSIVQSLMRMVAEVASLGMNVIGIPAAPQGNLIHIRDQTVGVDEACSGIRSLQTTLMIALFLGELSRLSWRRRVVLLFGGWTVAVAANVFRSSLLVWIAATHGTDALERFHDAAGISILVIVFVGLLWMSHWLGSRKLAPPPGFVDPQERIFSTPLLRPVSKGVAVAAGCWLIASEAGTIAWYSFRVPAPPSPVRWTVRPPNDAHGYQNLRIDDRSARLLRYDEGISARWDRPGVPVADCTLYFFRWEPGHASAVQTDMHQPHICLTASGLTQIADWGIQPLELSTGIVLPVRRYEFEWHRHPIFVFFVVWQEGNTPYTTANPVVGSRWDRLRLVLERRPLLGRQTVEFIVAGIKDPKLAEERFQYEISRMVHPLAGNDRSLSL